MARTAARTSIQTSTHGGAAWVSEHFWPVALSLLLIRLVFASRCNLVPDEAFYWTWTRHLATGYFDHPPMIAWVLWASTKLLGNTEIGVRMPAVLMSIGSLALLYHIGTQILRDSRALGFVLLMWICGPLMAVTGIIITPDAPANFFSVCGLACAVSIALRGDEDAASSAGTWSDARLWLLFGLFCGLAMLSKYTAVLLPGSVALACITSRKGLKHYRRPWIYLAGLIALAVFSPCIVWNAHHQWASFAFQLHHGADEGLTANVHGFGRKFIARAGGFAVFVGGQAVVWTPVLFGVVLLVMWRQWKALLRTMASHQGETRNAGVPANRNETRDASNDVKPGNSQRLTEVDRLLLWCGTVPLVFFAFAATRSHGELNWPAFAYFPLSLLVGRFLSDGWRPNRVQWVSLGCWVAVGFTVVVHLVTLPAVQQLILRRHFHLTHQVTDLWGWDVFGRQLKEEARGLPVVCNRHQDAGEAAFYMPGQPDVWCDSVGSRPTAFDYFDTGRPDLANTPDVLFEGDHLELFNRKWGFHTIAVKQVIMPGLGKKRSHTAAIVSR